MKRFLWTLVVFALLCSPCQAGLYIDDGADFYLRTRGYLMRDEFVTDRAAGAVNGTLSEPSGHTRSVTDTESKFSITGGALSVSGGKAVAEIGDPGYWINSAVTRLPGRIMLGELTFPETNKSIYLGWDSNTTKGGMAPNLNFYSDGYIYSNSSTKVAAYTSTSYQYAIILRASGSFKFIKGGAFTNWTLLYIDTAVNTSPMYVSIQNQSAAFTSYYIRVPAQFWLPTPLLSDSLDRADGALGTSDGSGHAETTGLGSGGGGLAWIDSVGTWAISTNKAMCTALVGGIGIATVDLSTSNVMHTVAATRSAGVVGGIIRYTDTDNYIKFYHDGTNAVLVKRVSGSETTKITGVVAYSAGADIRAVVDGSYLALYYNNALVGSVTDAAIPTGTRVGIYTTDTGNSVDNVRTYARGTEGQYSRLNWY